MKNSYLKLARFLSRRSYFKGRDRLTHLLLMRAARYGSHRIQVNGFVFDLNLVDSLSQFLCLYERFPGSTWKAIDLLLKPGMTMVDVGANIGYTTLIAARSVGPSGKVVAFEPGPRAFASLAVNKTLNNLDWLQVERMACSEQSGEMVLYTSSHSDEYNSLATAAEGEALLDKTVSCDVVQLGQYLMDRSIAQVDLIKIDVEGAEWQVLKGMKERLTGAKDGRPILIVEACLKNTSRFGYTPAEMFEYLADTGYDLRVLTTDGEVLSYDPSYVLSPEGLCDVICYDPSRQEQIDELQTRLA